MSQTDLGGLPRMHGNNDYSYLLERQSDPERLKRIAYEEFASARNSGRLIAFVGSYASAHFGYPDWKEMVGQYLERNRKLAGRHEYAQSVFEQLKGYSDASKFPDIDLMDLGELMAGIDRHANLDTYKEKRAWFGEEFSLRDVPNLSDNQNAAEALFKDLGITRFLTLNYDLEIEWQIFLTDYERNAFESSGETRDAFLRRHLTPCETPKSRLERAILGRGRVTSDVLAREDCAQLIEFALASPVLQSRVLHAHGRADDVANLLVTRRDYRDRYWQGGFSKLPFEYGLRLIFAGNPILFVGLGGTEDDVMRVLEQFLSDNPNRRAVPMFMVWNSESLAQDNARRLLFNRKYGIHVLFDEEIAALSGTVESYRKERDAYANNRPGHAKAFRLIEPLSRLAPLAESMRQAGDWTRSDFRSPQCKYDPKQAAPTTLWRANDPVSSYRVDVWRHVRGEDAACGTVHAVRRGKITDRATPPCQSDHDAAAPSLARALSKGKPIKAIIGESGIGRGAIADALASSYAEHFRDSAQGRVIVVNGAFATETDSIFGILSGAFNQLTAPAQAVSRAAATRELFGLQPRTPAVDLDVEDEVDATDQLPEGIHVRPGPLTIIINGMERFVGHDGSALSNEVDTLVRLVIEGYRQFEKKKFSLQAATPNTPAKAADAASEKVPQPTKENSDAKSKKATSAAPPEAFPLNLLLIGTQRLLRYLEVAAEEAFEEIQLERRAGHTILPLGPYDYWRECRPYFDVIATNINATEGGDEVITHPPAHHEKASRRREFFQRIFDHAFPAQRGVKLPSLAFELLRTLAYIGQPTEKHVLYHAPSLRYGSTPTEWLDNIDTCVDQLKKLGLILTIESFPSGKSERLGLHKTVIAEIRERYGVPMSDSRLANGFNLSLFTAQSIDSYTPDQRWHDEIGKLLDFLSGAYRDKFAPSVSILKAAKAAEREACGDLELAGILGTSNQADLLGRLASPEMSDCLRAALSLVRGYYSIPALLMHSNRDIDPWMRDGPLTEHAERLTRLIRIARQTAAARRLVAKQLKNKDDLGPPPLYPDDLMWLNNELGVVRLTQGSLYEARRKFSEASRINRLFVECGERQQNWRRIELNQVQVDIERGRIEQAEDRIRDIELVVEEQARLFTPDDSGYRSVRDYIMENYAGDRSFAGDGRPARIDPFYPTDLVLTTAITQGYRALCQHLRGALEPALESFEGALRILRHLNEQRAYAFFMRHLGALQSCRREPEQAEKSLRFCVAAAGHGRQTDIDHAGRISLVQYATTEHSAEQAKRAPKPIPQLTETLRYATASDMYRLQVEAMQTLAAVHLHNGDADSALRFATDALGIATRCGFGLRKVSLRILLGRVMAFRNDLDAARALLESASLIAIKLHYEQAVELAEDERVRIG